MLLNFLKNYNGVDLNQSEILIANFFSAPQVLLELFVYLNISEISKQKSDNFLKTLLVSILCGVMFFFIKNHSIFSHSINTRFTNTVL